MCRTLQGYDSVITFRDESTFSEGCPVFYRTDLYDLIDKGSFWLSETPEKMSKDWDSACYRICSYVILKEKQTGLEFVVFNTHLDHVSEEAIRQAFAEYRKRGITFVRDGGDALHVSEYASKIAPQYGIDYRSPMFAIHRKGHYGRIVGCAWEDLEEYRDLVKKVKDLGGDFIKIMISGIMVYEQFGQMSEEPLAPEEIRELIHIAHEEGMAVMAHVNGADAVRAAALAGADSIEHGNYIDRDCIDAMKEKGTVWVPTLVTTGNLLGCGRYPQEELEKIFDSARANVSCAWEKGVLLAAGSDAGAYRVLHGQGLVDEYQIFCDLFGETEELKNRLKEGESVIRRKFQAEKVWKLTSKSTIIDAASAS